MRHNILPVFCIVHRCVYALHTVHSDFNMAKKIFDYILGIEFEFTRSDEYRGEVCSELIWQPHESWKIPHYWFCISNIHLHVILHVAIASLADR